MIDIDKDDKLVSVKVYEPKQRRIKYIAETKEYFDKNGNSYWSSRVEDIEKDVVYVFPFQYGYGDQSEYTVKKALNIKNSFGEKPIIEFIKHEKCTKKSVKEWGTESEENYYADEGYYYLD
jgi:hypothetical protein